MTIHAHPLDADPIDFAHAYAQRGWRVLPIKPGEKRPPMKAWQEAATTEPAMIDKWWTELYRGHGVGVATGPASGIFVLDVDVSGDKAGDETLASLEAKYGELPATPTVTTASGGAHYYFCYPDHVEIRNDAGKRLGQGLDIRGDGGQVVAPPTMRGIDGYEWVDGTYGLDVADAPRWLIERVAELPKPSIVDVPMAKSTDGTSIAETYNTRTTWPQLLEADGWTLAEVLDDGEQHWTRPGKEQRDGISATVGHGGGDQLTVFTTSVEWLPAGSYSRFGYYAARFHAGDRSGAASVLRREANAQANAVLDAIPTTSVSVGMVSTGNVAVRVDEPTDSGWSILDFAHMLEDGYEPPAPSVLERLDGIALFYAFRTNALYGESGAGKSWVALLACVQEIRKHRHALYVDYEDHPASILRRLRDLGLTANELRTYFHYIQPQMAWNDFARAELEIVVSGDDFGIAVIDSTGEAMSLDGVDPNSDNEVAGWFRRFPRFLASLGPAVVLLDHVPKSKDAPGGFAIGSQRKRAAIDGASYRVNSIVAPAKGQRGILKLITAKDRGGYHQQGREVAEIVIEDNPLDGVSMKIDEPTPDRSSNLVVEIRGVLAAHTEGLSVTDIAKAIGRSHGSVERSVKEQMETGMIVRTGSGRSTRHFLAVRDEDA